MEISKVKASDAGEYTCVATNVLGSTKNTCQVDHLNTLTHSVVSHFTYNYSCRLFQVIVLDSHDPSTSDKSAPKFLQSLPDESIVMEGHCYELQTRLMGIFFIKCPHL